MGKDTGKHRVVIVGGGFGGLTAAHELAGAGVETTLVDRRNHHLFQPLLYQVATTALSPSEIAWPIRQLLRHDSSVTTLLGSVVGVDRASRQVYLEDGASLPYDSLIIATGATHGYFGHDEWAGYAPGLKTLEDATAIRRRLLLAFERAERENDAERRQALLTFVVIGAGPTGVELAGAIVELARITLREDFRTIRSETARVLLVEAGDRVLPTFRKELSDYALRALRDLGVEVVLEQPATAVTADTVTFGGETVAAGAILWAAGVQASPAAKWLGAEADKSGRIKVLDDFSVPGSPEIFAVGDTVAITDADGRRVPGIGDAAKQGGRHAAQVIKARLLGERPPPFRYRHAGDIATIGRRAAVIDFGWIQLTGRLAWWAWGLAHIYFLIGLKNRIAVALSWLWIYLTGHRSARLITQGEAGASPPWPDARRSGQSKTGRTRRPVASRRNR